MNKLANAAGRSHALDLLGLTKEAVSPQWIASKATSGMKKRFPAAFENAGAHGKQLNPAQVQSEIAERMTRIKGDFAGDIASQKSMSKGMLGFDTKNVEAVAKRNQAAQTAQKPWQRESPLTNNMMDSAFGGGTKRAPSTNIPAAKKPTPPKQPIQPLQ